MHVKLTDEQRKQLTLQDRLQRNLLTALRKIREQVEASETAKDLGICVTDEVLEKTVLMFAVENCKLHMKNYHPDDPATDLELCTGIATVLGEVFQEVSFDLSIDRATFDS